MNIRVRRAIAFLAVAGTLFACGCATDGGRMRHRLRSLAGPGAIDCGDSLFPNLVPKNNACAIGASVERAPFYIRWEIHDGSSRRMRGIAMNSNGLMFMVTENFDDPAHGLPMIPCSTSQLVPDPSVTSIKLLTCAP